MSMLLKCEHVYVYYYAEPYRSTLLKLRTHLRLVFIIIIVIIIYSVPFTVKITDSGALQCLSMRPDSF